MEIIQWFGGKKTTKFLKNLPVNKIDLQTAVQKRSFLR